MQIHPGTLRSQVAEWIEIADSALSYESSSDAISSIAEYTKLSDKLQLLLIGGDSTVDDPEYVCHILKCISTRVNSIQDQCIPGISLLEIEAVLLLCLPGAFEYNLADHTIPIPADNYIRTPIIPLTTFFTATVFALERNSGSTCYGRISCF